MICAEGVCVRFDGRDLCRGRVKRELVSLGRRRRQLQIAGHERSIRTRLIAVEDVRSRVLRTGSDARLRRRRISLAGAGDREGTRHNQVKFSRVAIGGIVRQRKPARGQQQICSRFFDVSEANAPAWGYPPRLKSARSSRRSGRPRAGETVLGSATVSSSGELLSRRRSPAAYPSSRSDMQIRMQLDQNCFRHLIGDEIDLGLSPEWSGRPGGGNTSTS